MINEGHIYKNKRSKRRLKWSVQMGCKYSRFRVSFKREKCPPRVETATDKWQTQEKLDHVTLSTVRGKRKYAVLHLSINNLSKT